MSVFQFPGSSFDFITRNSLVQVGPSVNVAAKLCAFNPNRVFLQLQDSAGSIFYGPAGVTSTTGWVFSVFSNAGPVVMPYYQYGPWVQAEWWGVRGSGQSNTAVMEVIYAPQAAPLLAPAGEE